MGYMKQYRGKNKEKIKIYSKEYRKKNKEKLSKYRKKYYQEHYKAHPKLILSKEELIKRKKESKKREHIHQKIKYPEKVQVWKSDYKKRKNYCELCGSKENLQFHHLDYPNRIGITLCFVCHRNIHNNCKEVLLTQ